jgi:hypothetical protein
MNHPDFSDAQAQLVKCQEALDAARQEGWTVELLETFLDATRALHEAAAVRKAIYGQPSQTPVTSVEDVTEPASAAPQEAPPREPAVNRLLTPEEKGEAEPAAQVDLLSSIGEMTLAEKLALQPLGSVAEGMSILDRAQFTSILFGGNEEVFSALLSKLSKASTQEEAFAMFQESLCAQDAPEVDPLKEAFAKRIMRTFVS